MAFADDVAAQQATITATQTAADTYLQTLLAITDVSFSYGFNIDDVLDTTGLAPAFNIELPTIEYPIEGVKFAPDEIEIKRATTDLPPKAPTLEFGAPKLASVEDFTGAAPTPDFPQSPDAGLPDAPGVSPKFEPPVAPEAPPIEFPDPPVLETISFPDPIPVSIPPFMGVLPSDTLAAPTLQYAYHEAAYQSVLLDPLKSKLLDNLVNGGYGIETADEIALFNRARDREIETTLSRIDDAGRSMAARGFPLPPGEMSVHIDRAYQDMQNKVSNVSRDIMLERGKLYVENRQFTIKEIRDLETVLLNFHSSVQERALNVSRATMEFSIAIFNSLVEKYNARVSAYRAYSDVFVAQIRAESLKVEIYRGQLEAAKTKAEVQRTQVEVYNSQIRGLEMVVNVYKTQMEAAKLATDIERLKLEAFQSEVAAYTAQVQAKTAEFGVYQAQLEGEISKVQVYESQVKAYTGRVEAEKMKADFSNQQLQAEIERARAQNMVYTAQLDRYKAEMEREVAATRVQVDYYTAAISEARMKNDVTIAEKQAEKQRSDHLDEWNIKVRDLKLAEARAKLEATVAALKFKTEGTHYAGEKLYAQLSALMSTINTLSVSTVST